MKICFHLTWKNYEHTTKLFCDKFLYYLLSINIWFVPFLYTYRPGIENNFLKPSSGWRDSWCETVLWGVDLPHRKHGRSEKSTRNKSRSIASQSPCKWANPITLTWDTSLTLHEFCNVVKAREIIYSCGGWLAKFRLSWIQTWGSNLEVGCSDGLIPSVTALRMCEDWLVFGHDWRNPSG